jgi:hypothetical protein
MYLYEDGKSMLFVLMPAALYLATTLSLLFGQPISQFEFSGEFMIMRGNGLASLLILFAAPA